MKKYWVLVIVVCFITICSVPLTAQEQDDDELFEELLELLEEDTSISSNVTSSINEAPGIITVITAKQIRDMGARTLQDVLRIVPGFDAWPYNTSGFPLGMYIVRGIKNFTNANVLILYNGARMNEFYSGSTWSNDYHMFLENIQRIEIIRGPGSALYGANAFTAVINLVTKTPAEIDGVELGAEGSTFPGQRYYGLAGKQFEEWSTSLFAQYHTNDGQRSFIEEDRGGRSGDIQDKQIQNVALDYLIGYKDFTAELRYLYGNTHAFYGDTTINTPSNEDLGYTSNTFTFHSRYQKFFLNEKLRLRALAEYKWADPSYVITLASFPLWSRFKTHIDDLAGELLLSYALFEGNIVTVGGRLGQERFFDNEHGVREFDPSTGMTSGEWTEIPPLPDVNRSILSVYAEDVWEVSRKIQVTLGGRVDKYSDFGSTFNPRLAFVYLPKPVVSLKLLYGRAFRVPSWLDLWNSDQETLNPETIDTYEAGVSWDFWRNLALRANIFYTMLDDLIEENPETGRSENIGEVTSRGFEVELKGTFGTGNYAWVNYSYCDPEDSKTDEPLYGQSAHGGSAGINFDLVRYLNLNLWGYVQGERLQKFGGKVSELGSYANINLNLRLKNLFDSRLEGYLTAYNLLDNVYEYPLQEGKRVRGRGREGLLGIRYTF